jgi:hypothetical protein
MGPVGGSTRTKHSSRASPALGQRGNSHPEHIFTADRDVVFADEIELSVATHTKHGETGRNRIDAFSSAHGKLHHVGRYQNPTARIDP